MKTKRPKIQRTYVEMRDPDSGERIFRTYYEATPSEIAGRIEQTATVPSVRCAPSAPRKRGKLQTT